MLGQVKTYRQGSNRYRTHLIAQKWKQKKVSSPIRKCETIWKQTLIILMGSTTYWKPHNALEFESLTCSKGRMGSAFLQYAPHLYNPKGPSEQREGCCLAYVTDDVSYSSSGALTREEKRRQSLTPWYQKAKLYSAELKKNEECNCWALQRGRSKKIKKKEKYFIMLMRKRENWSTTIFLK